MLFPPDRAKYIKELSNVVGILAYKIPEESSVSRYLSQERRAAVAEQINSAILCKYNSPCISVDLTISACPDRSGLPVIPKVELAARYTSTLWGLCHDFRAPALPGTVLPTKSGKDTPTPSFKRSTSSGNTKDEIVCPS